MGRLSDMSDRDIERLFAVRTSEDDGEFGDIARFFGDLREAYPEASTESHEAAHVAAMIDAAQLLTEKGEPVVRPASKAHGPAKQASGLPKRRNVMVRRFLSSRLAMVTAIAALLAVVFGGVAIAGALPGPIQNAVAGAAEQVGIGLPQAGDVQDAIVDEVDDTIVDDSQDEAADEADGAGDKAVETDDEADGAIGTTGGEVDDEADNDDEADQTAGAVDRADEADQTDDEADQTDDETEEATD